MSAPSGKMNFQWEAIANLAKIAVRVQCPGPVVHAKGEHHELNTSLLLRTPGNAPSAGRRERFHHQPGRHEHHASHRDGLCAGWANLCLHAGWASEDYQKRDCAGDGFSDA